MKKSASQKRITTRKPNETLAHFQDRVGVPTTGDRVKRAMHSLTLIAAAAGSEPDGCDVGDILDAVHVAAKKAQEELFWLTQMAPAGLDALAPDSDQENRLKRTA